MYEHVQAFLKRLRAWDVRQARLLKCAPSKVRFFCAGEYGDKFGRPHYHLILFNVAFPDAVPAGRGKRGDTLYSSKVLDGLWRHGLCQFGDVTRESINYVARYCHDLVTGDLARETYRYVDPESGEVTFRRPPFAQMSRLPGLGIPWLRRYFGDVFPRDYCLLDGRQVPVPRLYLIEASRFCPDVEEVVQANREEANAFPRSPDLHADRLPAREDVLRAKFKLKPREVIK